MSVNIGIIGLAKSGRTTVFNALTGAPVEAKTYSQEASAPHIGIAKLPDPRLKVLASMFKPRKVTPAEVMYIDIGASVRSLAEGKEISGQLFTQLSKTDALVNVVRAFKDDSVPHPEGSVNVERDVASMNLEMAIADMAIAEKRLERIEGTLKSAKPADRPSIIREQELLERIKKELGKDKPVRELDLTPEESKAITGYQFLTAKPLLIVVNIGEEQLSQAGVIKADLIKHYSRPQCRVTTICGKLEMELSEMGTDADSLRAGYGIKEPGPESIIKLSFELLELRTFLTVVSDEVRAWSIPEGTPSVKAAGKVHSDMERGFIRAEVTSFDDLVKCGSLGEARKKGLLRAEGKNYIVKDGDVINFLFNV